MPNQIGKLGDALDRAEIAANDAWLGDCGRFWLMPDSLPAAKYYRRCDRQHVAMLRYANAVTARNLASRIKFQNRKTTPHSRDAFKLRHAMNAAQARCGELLELCHDFSTERERIDARAAADLAERLYDIAQEKYQNAERQRRADKAAGIVRRFPRRKSNEVHAS